LELAPPLAPAKTRQRRHTEKRRIIIERIVAIITVSADKGMGQNSTIAKKLRLLFYSSSLFLKKISY
jgi:hypothetical protein